MTLPPKLGSNSSPESWPRWCDRKHVVEPIQQGQFPEIPFLIALLRSKDPLAMPVRKQIATWIREKRFDQDDGEGPAMDQIASDLVTVSKPVPTSVRQFLAQKLETGKLKRPRGRRPDINPFADALTRITVQRVFDQQSEIVDAERASIKPRDSMHAGLRRPLEEKLWRASGVLAKEGIHVRPGKIRQIIELRGKWKP